MKDDKVPEFYHYLEAVGHRYVWSTRDWKLWEPDFREGILP